ncbi:hypothetical protein COBT_000408 [Conglomerata obtusa]
MKLFYCLFALSLCGTSNYNILKGIEYQIIALNTEHTAKPKESTQQEETMSIDFGCKRFVDIFDNKFDIFYDDIRLAELEELKSLFATIPYEINTDNLAKFPNAINKSNSKIETLTVSDLLKDKTMNAINISLDIFLRNFINVYPLIRIFNSTIKHVSVDLSALMEQEKNFDNLRSGLVLFYKKIANHKILIKSDKNDTKEQNKNSHEVTDYTCVSKIFLQKYISEVVKYLLGKYINKILNAAKFQRFSGKQRYYNEFYEMELLKDDTYACFLGRNENYLAFKTELPISLNIYNLTKSLYDTFMTVMKNIQKNLYTLVNVKYNCCKEVQLIINNIIKRERNFVLNIKSKQKIKQHIFLKLRINKISLIEFANILYIFYSEIDLLLSNFNPNKIIEKNHNSICFLFTNATINFNYIKGIMLPEIIEFIHKHGVDETEFIEFTVEIIKELQSLFIIMFDEPSIQHVKFVTLNDQDDSFDYESIHRNVSEYFTKDEKQLENKEHFQAETYINTTTNKFISWFEKHTVNKLKISNNSKVDINEKLQKVYDDNKNRILTTQNHDYYDKRLKNKKLNVTKSYPIKTGNTNHIKYYHLKYCHEIWMSKYKNLESSEIILNPIKSVMKHGYYKNCDNSDKLNDINNYHDNNMTYDETQFERYQSQNYTWSVANKEKYGIGNNDWASTQKVEDKIKNDYKHSIETAIYKKNGAKPKKQTNEIIVKRLNEKEETKKNVNSSYHSMNAKNIINNNEQNTIGPYPYLNHQHSNNSNKIDCNNYRQHLPVPITQYAIPQNNSNQTRQLIQANYLQYHNNFNGTMFINNNIYHDYNNVNRFNNMHRNQQPQTMQSQSNFIYPKQQYNELNTFSNQNLQKINQTPFDYQRTHYQLHNFTMPYYNYNENNNTNLSFQNFNLMHPARNQQHYMQYMMDNNKFYQREVQQRHNGQPSRYKTNHFYQ